MHYWVHWKIKFCVFTRWSCFSILAYMLKMNPIYSTTKWTHTDCMWLACCAICKPHFSGTAREKPIPELPAGSLVPRATLLAASLLTPSLTLCSPVPLSLINTRYPNKTLIDRQQGMWNIACLHFYALNTSFVSLFSFSFPAITCCHVILSPTLPWCFMFRCPPFTLSPCSAKHLGCK